MTDLREAAQMALDAYESRMQQIGGCFDGGCVVVKPKGMHTNGGCKCWKNERSMQRLAMAANSLTKALRAALAQPESDGPTPSEQYAFERGFQRARQITREQWQGLTDEELRSMCKQTWVFDTIKQWAKIIESKLKEKNA